MRKGRRDRFRSFVALERKVLLHDEAWKSLSMKAKIFYLYLKAKYNGQNNGKIQLHYSELRDQQGFSCKSSFYGAARELQNAGWIKRTDPGGLYRNPNLYELTGQFDGMLSHD